MSQASPIEEQITKEAGSLTTKWANYEAAFAEF